MTQWSISGKYPWGHERYSHNIRKHPIPGKESECVSA